MVEVQTSLSKSSGNTKVVTTDPEREEREGDLSAGRITITLGSQIPVAKA